MEIKALQRYVKQSGSEMQKPFASAPEIMTAIIEVSQEVSLIEQIGSKAEWEKKPSKARLAEEMTHLLNLIIALANFYDIDLQEMYTRRLQ